MKQRLLILCALMGLAPTLIGQESFKFSLDEAISYAMKHNHNLINADLDIEIARKKVMETTAIGLPQINASGSYSDFIKMPTTLIPAQFFDPNAPEGEFAEAQFGTKYNIEGELSASQLLFNGSYLVGLQASHAWVKQTLVAREKTEQETKEAISNAYYIFLLNMENEHLMQDNLENLNKMTREIRAMANQGFTDITEVEQLELLTTDLKTNLIYIQNNVKNSKDYLKLLCGLKLSDKLTLTQSLESLMADLSVAKQVTKPFNPNLNTDYRIIDAQEQLAMLNVKNQQAAYLPVLSAFFSAKESAMRNEFDFLKSEVTYDRHWFPVTLWGLRMDIPIWSSGMKSAKVKQAKLELDKIKTSKELVENSILLEVSNTRNELNNAWKVFENKTTALKLADKIYKQTQKKFKEGLAGQFELSQAYEQYLKAEGGHLSAQLTLLTQKTKLERLMSEL